MQPDEKSISASHNRYFRVHIIWRAVGTLVLSAGAAVFGFVLAQAACMASLETATFWDPESIFFTAILVCPTALSCLLAACGLYLTIAALWKHSVRISDAGIKYRTLGLSHGMLARWPVFENRFAPWEEIVGIERLTGKELYVVLACGRRIDVSLTADKDQMVALISANLERMGRSCRAGAAVSKSKRAARIGVPMAVVLTVPLTLGSLIAFAEREEKRQMQSCAIHLSKLDLTDVYGQHLDITFRSGDRLLVGDVTGDGKKDLVVNPRRIRVSETYGPSLTYGVPGLIYEGVGNGFVRSHLESSFSEADQCSILSVGDFDGDDRVELLVVMRNSTIGLLKWNDRQFDAIWEGVRPEALVQREGDLCVGDFDGDRKDEIAALCHGKRESNMPEKRVHIIGWNGTALVSEYNAVCGRDGELLLAGVGDSDHDGISEFYLVECSDSGMVESARVYVVSDLGLVEHSTYTPCVGEERWTYERLGGVGDLDYDGRVELALVTTGTGVRCGRLIGNQFSTVRLGVYPKEIIYVGDLYGIGKDVVVVISECGQLRVSSADSKLLKRLKPSVK